MTGDPCLGTCCSDGSCCSGACCDGACCSSGKCCNGLCCPYSNGVCCDGVSGGCCGSTQFCCNGNKCCPNGTECCSDGTCCEHACDACVDNGTLEKANPTDTITVSADTVCVGDTVTFTAPAVVDTGGLKWVNCADVPLSGGVEYHWSLTLPAGYPAPLPPTSGTGASVSVNALVAGSYAASFTATPTRTECPPGNLALGSASADTGVIEITAERIDQDNPTNAAWEALAEGLPVYGGSEASTADNLTLSVSPGPNVSAIIWSVEGSGGAAYAAPPSPTDPNAVKWDLGDLLSPAPGKMTFKVRVSYTYGSSRCGKFETEIGVRTDDVIVVGWINPAGVTLPVWPSAYVAALMPATGPPVPSSLDCNLFILDLSENFTTPNFQTLTGVDRDYILLWMFKYAGNANPGTVIAGGDFRDATDSHEVESEIQAFLGTPTNYKLFNRLQIRFLVGTNGFSGAPTILHAHTATGNTVNPCGAVAGFLGVFGSQTGPSDQTGLVTGNNTRVVGINDGSPDAGAIRAFNTLMGKDLPVGQTPLFWENIGSKISLHYDGTSSGDIAVQPYPTYFVYVNGKPTTVIPQAWTPKAHFYMFPYPFGTVWCVGLGGTTPGGRCGDAASPAEPSAQIPSSGYTLP